MGCPGFFFIDNYNNRQNGAISIMSSDRMFLFKTRYVHGSGYMYIFCPFYLEAEGLFPPVTIFLNLFPCAGYFFNAVD